MKSITFMVLGDAHLDSDFKQDCNDRRREMREAFDEAISIVKKYAIDYLFIPGDLFDKRNPGSETVNYVKNAFAALKHTNIIIAPGNHDPYTVDSAYYTENWPINVHIFKDKTISYFEFTGTQNPISTVSHDKLFSNGIIISEKRGVRIYGAAFDGHFIKDSMLYDETGKLPRLTSGFVNILLMHGTFKKEKASFNPIDREALKSAGFDFSVIGGTHTQNSNDNILSSGVLYPRNFSESGDSGVLVGEINENGQVLTEFIPINKMVYEIIDFDITDINDLSCFAIADEIKKIGREGTSIRVNLIGTSAYAENVDAKAISEQLLGYYTIAEVIDKTTKSDNIKILSQENSPRGLFVKEVLLRTSGENNEFTLSEADDTIYAALKLFSKKEEAEK